MEFEIELPFKLAKEDEVVDGKAFVVTLPSGIQIALFKIDGKIYALDNACPHMGGPLGEGDIYGEVVTCPWHGWQFDIKNGLNLSGLGEDALPLKVSVREGFVYLDK